MFGSNTDQRGSNNIGSNENLKLELTLSLTPSIPQSQQVPQLEETTQVARKLPQVPQLEETTQVARKLPQVRNKKRIRIHQSAEANNVINPPFQWAKNEPCHVHSLRYLRTKCIVTISGEVKCKRCGDKQTEEINLSSGFNEISSYFEANKGTMHDRAPGRWKTPETPGCKKCGPNLMKPVLAENNDNINWLFLLLTQMLGCCTLDQLKYFCKKNGKHSTGAKDRILYSTYVELGKQLDPNGPFGH